MKHLFLLVLFVPSLLKAIPYTVQKGDSLWSIADKYGLSQNLIKKVNDLYKDGLQPGQKLFLPKEIVTYKVRMGDSLESIAEEKGIPTSYLVILNNLVENQLFDGQELKIPIEAVINYNTSTAALSKPKTHKVARGESLGGIALRYKISIDRLKKINNKKTDALMVGEVLLLEYKGNTAAIKEKTLQTNTVTHIVQPNQTLGAIALRYKVSQNDIKKWNNKSSSTVYRGEKLKIYNIGAIPSVNTVSKPKNADAYTEKIYQVRRGDSLLDLALKFKVSVKDIKDWNKKTKDGLYVNEKIIIRVPKSIQNSTPAQKQTVVYTVKRGDTLDSVAIKLGTTRQKLLAANGKKNNTIYVGEKLKITLNQPAGAVALKNTSQQKVKAALPPKGINSSRFFSIPLPVAYSDLKVASPSGRGVDIYLNSMSTLIAPAGAVVEYAGYINALQNVVILKLPEDRTLVYAGLSEVNVNAGQKISKGDVLGKAGYSALDESAKIYLEIRDNNRVANALYSYKDLAKYIKK